MNCTKYTKEYFGEQNDKIIDGQGPSMGDEECFICEGVHCAQSVILQKPISMVYTRIAGTC